MTPDREITIQYFALLKEERGIASEVVVTAATTPRELYRELRQKYGFTLDCNQLGVAVNSSFDSWDAGLNPGDSVVFIPPVAGG